MGWTEDMEGPSVVISNEIGDVIHVVDNVPGGGDINYTYHVASPELFGLQVYVDGELWPTSANEEINLPIPEKEEVEIVWEITRLPGSEDENWALEIFKYNPSAIIFSEQFSNNTLDENWVGDTIFENSNIVDEVHQKIVTHDGSFYQAFSSTINFSPVDFHGAHLFVSAWTPEGVDGGLLHLGIPTSSGGYAFIGLEDLSYEPFYGETLANIMEILEKSYGATLDHLIVYYELGVY
jgi:hypothetical protein